jgi:hypothetical protein
MAGELVALFEKHADFWENGEAPAWHGWALHRCFLLGLQMGRGEAIEPVYGWHHWTPEEDEDVRQHWQSQTDGEIGRRMGRDKEAVARRRSKLGLTRGVNR